MHELTWTSIHYRTCILPQLFTFISGYKGMMTNGLLSCLAYISQCVKVEGGHYCCLLMPTVPFHFICLLIPMFRIGMSQVYVQCVKLIVSRIFATHRFSQNFCCVNYQLYEAVKLTKFFNFTETIERFMLSAVLDSAESS